MSIEDVIKEMARKGRFSLPLLATSNKTFQANLSVDGNKSWRVEIDEDPVKAIKKVLGLIPGAAGRMRVSKENSSIFD